VRAQLLSHLGNAASKASRDAAAPKPTATFFGTSTSDASRNDKPSPLTNITAALLSSIQRLAQRPSRSALRPELTPAFGAVLARCLADPDAAVRRAAAQAVGLLGQLLGERGGGGMKRKGGGDVQGVGSRLVEAIAG
jgi:HEAT repeat protein